MKNNALYKHTLLFYMLSTIIPWFFWFVAAYISRNDLSNFSKLAIPLFGFIGLIAPMFISFVILKLDNNLWSDFKSRFFSFGKIKPIYIFLTCFLMLISILLAQAISLFFGHDISQFVITGTFTFTSGVFPVWALLILAPVFEELAWHSYGTDCIRSRFSLFTTCMIFAIFWGIWHIPLGLIKDYYQSNLVLSGWIYTANFFISLFPYVLIMNWLYFKTNRNIFVAIVFHITAGYFNEIFATHPDSKVIQTLLLLIFSIFIILKEKEFFFKDKFVR